MKKRTLGKTILGLVEKVVFLNSVNGGKEVLARIDTGATKCSIDINLAKSLKLGPVIRSKLVKSAHGKTLRPLIEATIMIAGKKITTEFSLADRNHMKYMALIGQNVLKKGFLIDPSK